AEALIVGKQDEDVGPLLLRADRRKGQSGRAPPCGFEKLPSGLSHPRRYPTKSTGHDILRDMLKNLALFLSVMMVTFAADRHGSLERRLYVTDKSGISVYDIDNGHKLLRKIDLPGSGDYKGISASPHLGKLYVTSYKGDEMICLDLRTDALVWKKKYG